MHSIFPGDNLATIFEIVFPSPRKEAKITNFMNCGQIKGDVLGLRVSVGSWATFGIFTGEVN